jgi:hypothetical protein
MKTILRGLPAALLALAACGNEPETVVSGVQDTQAEELSAAAPVTLPPSIQSSKTYRCRDNSLVYVNVLTDGTVNVRADQNAQPEATLTRAEPEGPLTAEGYFLSGIGDTVEYSSPTVERQSCKG